MLSTPYFGNCSGNNLFQQQFLMLQAGKPSDTWQGEYSDKSQSRDSTPIKKPKYSQEPYKQNIRLQTSINKNTNRKSQLQRGRRVKSITKMVQKQSSSLLYSLLVIVWVVTVAIVLLLAFKAKMEGVEAAALQQINQCKHDYLNNRCQTPVKGIINFCNQKLVCFNQNPVQLAARRVSYSRIAGEIAQEYANGAGIAGMLFGVILVWLCLRQKGKEKSVTSIQFYED